MDTNLENRKISRANLKIEGQAKYKGILFKGRIENLSLNGFMFKSDEIIDITIGQKLTITIQILGEEPHMESNIDCIVVRKTDNVLGLNFSALDYDTLLSLKDKLVSIIGSDKINEEFIRFVEDI